LELRDASGLKLTEIEVMRSRAVFGLSELHKLIAMRLSRIARGNFSRMQAMLQAEIDGIHAAGTYKNERVITSPQRSEITVEGSDELMLNFCANNYLGLSADPELIAEAKLALDSHGFGLSSVRFICGTQDIHTKLEDAISKFHGTEATILYPSCFDANAGLFEQMLGPEDAVLSDSLNHASIIDGIRLCKAKRFRYNHMDMDDLERQLQESADCRFRLIATDGAFSMDGDVAPLEAICDLADKYDAQVYIDECHATGFLGATGRGTDEHCGVQGRIDVINSTLGKALGGATGGYTTGRKEIVEVLRQRARPYLFSNSLAPPLVAASLKVFERLEASSELVDTLRRNTHQFRDALTAAGFTMSGDYDHPIAPVMLGDARLASDFADKMLERGIYVIGFSYPVVPQGAARIRTQLSAAHTPAQIERAAAAFIDIGKELGVIA
jgi:glycine C-acetyltransferase